MSKHDEAARLAEAIEHLVAVVLRQRGQIGVEPSPLTATQALAIAAVADAGPLRLGELAARIGTTDATASRTVDTLADNGLVERQPDPDDRRSVRIAATAEGQRINNERRHQLTEMATQLLSRLPRAHQARFIDVLTELNQLLQTASTDNSATR